MNNDTQEEKGHEPENKPGKRADKQQAGKSEGDTAPQAADEAVNGANDAERGPGDIDEISGEIPEGLELLSSEETDLLIAERDEFRDKWMRALAEGENLRKRAAKERRDAEVYGGTRLARDLLSVYDNMSRALEAIDDGLLEQAGSLVEGIELTRRELLSVFEKHEIRRVAPEIGDAFDPNLHQAMFEAPVEGHPAGTIIQVAAEGFEIGDRLLRPAQVGVSSGSPKGAN